MKKIVSAMLAGVLVCGALNAQSIKVTNTFGGDSDNTGSSDLFTYDRQKNEDGSYKDKYGNTTRASDRLQLDVSGKDFDSRLRMEIGTTKLNGKESSVRFRGYGRFKIVDGFQVIAGNDFFTKVAVDAGYLAASDDYPKYARILQNGFGGIVKGSFGNDNEKYFNIAGGIKGTDDSYNDKDTFGLDAGMNFGIKNVMSVGASLQNMAGNNLSAGVFVGLNNVENLILNAGYIYNNTDTDFIAKSAKNTISLSAGYKFQESGIFLAADVMSAISNEYLEDGDTKEYENDGKKLIPFLAKGCVSYKVKDNLTAGVKAKVAMMIGDDDSRKTELYPNIVYTLADKMGTVTTGVRLNLDKDGLYKIAIPLSWKCTFADIKK